MPPPASCPPISTGLQSHYALRTHLHATGIRDGLAERNDIRHVQSFDLQVEHEHQHASPLHRSDGPESTLGHKNRALLDQYRRPHRLAKGLAFSESQLDFHACDDDDSALVREAPAAETTPESRSIPTAANSNRSSYQHNENAEIFMKAEESSPPKMRNTYESCQPVEHESWAYVWNFGHQPNRFSLTEETRCHWLFPEQMPE